MVSGSGMHGSPVAGSPARRRSGAMGWLLGLAAGCLLAALCLACLVVAGAAGLFIYGEQIAAGPTASVTPFSVELPSPTVSPSLTATPFPGTPTPTVAADTPTPTAPPPSATPEFQSSLNLAPPADIRQEPARPQMFLHLENLYTADYPVHDFHESAGRLGARLEDIGPRTVENPPYNVGDVQTFFVSEGTVDATLVYSTERIYAWVEEGLTLDVAALQQGIDRFEQEYYPALVHLVGPEWSPGVDGDPRFSILHVSGNMGDSDELGFFNSGDEYPRTFYQDSNEQEIVYLNMSNLDLGEELYYGTLVHEFQHLAQWYVDGNETTWMDEGLAQLAELYVGLETAGFIDFMREPDVQLNSWNYEDDSVYAHYGASYLFMVYVWEQLGEEAVRELARHPANGLTAVRSVLAGYRPDLTLEQFVANWTVANLLDVPGAGAEYNYERLDLDRVRRNENVRVTPFEDVASLSQLGTHYVALDMSGSTTVSFAGDTIAELAPVDPYSGSQMWYAPPFDAVDATLTREFDLTGVERATLSFQVWYDLEEDYDFALVSISTDGGQSWDLLVPDQARPSVHGPVFNGASAEHPDADEGGWVAMTVPMHSYVGRPVLVRFEVLTDPAIVLSGFAVDDLAIAELGYVDDVEGDAGGWQAAGFVQTGRWLAQQWSVQLVKMGLFPEVMPLTLDTFNQGRWTFDLEEQGGILVITPLMPFTTEPANYWLFVE